MIRYDQKLQKEINKVVKNFNQKVKRLEKEGRELLPEKVSIKELKQDYTTRTDLRRKLKELQRFSKRGIEDVIEISSGKITKYELENIKRESARVKRKISREITKYETKAPTVFGKKQDTTYAKMGDNDYLNRKARREALEKDITKLSREQLQRYKKLINKTLKKYDYLDKELKENYIKSLLDLGTFYGIDKEKITTINDKLMDLSGDKLVELFNNDRSIKAVLEYYDMYKREFKKHPEYIDTDVNVLFDNLYENIDLITGEYM